MHQYLTDESVKQKVFIGAAILAIFSGWALGQIIDLLPFPVPWWVETPSVLGFFGLYVWLFDNHLWKKWPFYKLEWLNIPDISGDWDVGLTSSYKGFEEEIPAKARIRQAASRLCVSLETANSKSYSTFGALVKTDKIHSYELIYQYINQPKPNALKTMEIHYGTAWLTINKDQMEGEYYTGRGRQQFGKIELCRKQANIIKL